jgi:tetratricopeptide (TPR) repeat protein
MAALATIGTVHTSVCAQAAETSAVPPPAEAIEFYRIGREHFVAGRYREAITDLERALQLDPGSPTLLYNLARVHELLGELAEALRYYNAYSALLPATEREEHERVDETIARLEGAREHDQLATEPPHTPPEGFRLDQPVVTRAHGVADLWFWIAAGTSALSLVTAAVVGIVTLQQRASLDDIVVGNPDQCVAREECADSWDARADTVRDLALTTDILFALGAAAGVTAGLLYFLRTEEIVTYPGYDGDGERSGARPFLDVSPDRALFGVRGAL